jgi:hypothetical protein
MSLFSASPLLRVFVVYRAGTLHDLLGASRSALSLRRARHTLTVHRTPIRHFWQGIEYRIGGGSRNQSDRESADIVMSVSKTFGLCGIKFVVISRL